VRDKRGRLLQECAENVEQLQTEIQELNAKVENARGVTAKIEKEINESGSSTANLRENIRVRRMKKDIIQLQRDIESHDVEEAGRAKRNFEDRYKVEKQKETELQAKVCATCLDFLLLTHTPSVCASGW
jgi:DNA repair protein RAD50